MAYVVSPVWSKIRGSIAGTTYLAGPDHPIIARQRVTPVNPNTPYQQMMRSGVINAVMQWENMVETDRAGWEAYAEAMGESGMGRRFFIGAYSKGFYMNAHGDPLIELLTTPPSISGLFNISVYPYAPLGVAGIGFQISVDNLEPADDGVIQSNIAGPFNTARYKFKGPFSGESFDQAALMAQTTGVFSFSGLVLGGIYFVKINGVTGKVSPGVAHRLSNTFISRAIATETAEP